MNKNMYGVQILLLLFTFLYSCSSNAPNAEEKEKSTEPGILPYKSAGIDSSGAESGFELKGVILPPNQVVQEQYPLNAVLSVEESQLPARHYPVTGTIALPGSPKKISFGKGAFLPVTKSKLGEPTRYRIEPDIIPALPFQKIMLEKLSYKLFGGSQGLKSSFITAIFQDSRGYLWFGGRRGLTRYDGSSFYYYAFTNDGQRQGIGAISEDADGNIWMSFGSFGGLMKYDGHFFYEYKENKGLNIGEEYLGIIHSDKKGNIWLKSETRVLRFDGKTFTSFPYRFQNLKNLNVIMKENGQGSFWLSGLGGVCSLKGDEMYYYPIEPYPENNLCHPVMEDERGLIIVTGTGISVLKNDALRIYPSRFIKERLIRNTLSVGENFILVGEDRDNAYCTLEDNALSVVTDKNPVFTGAIPLFVDRFKNVWLGTEGKGVICYNPLGFRHFKFENQKIGGHISALMEDRNRNIWFGSHGFGLYQYDGIRQTYYPLIPGDSRVVIRSLLQDHAGNIWVGTRDYGLLKIERREGGNNQVTRFNCFPEEKYTVFALTEDTDHHIWIGTEAHGLLKYDGNFFYQYKEVPSPVRIGSDSDQEINRVRALLSDPDGSLWIGSQQSGLWHYDGEKFLSRTEQDKLSSRQVVSLFRDKGNALWVGTTDAGVDRLGAAGVTNISTKDGLSSNAIWTISGDEQGHIWLGAGSCLNVILNETKDSLQNPWQIKTICNMEGLEGAEFYANTGMKDHRNQLWWGTDQMAVMLSDPDELIKPARIKVSLEELHVVNNRVDYRNLQDSILLEKNWICGPEGQFDLAELQFSEIQSFTNCPLGLEVPSHLNDLSFVFSAKGINDATHLEFSYFMQGIDKTWSIPSKNNQINYRNLDDGTYILYTRVSEVKGVWSEPVAYTFAVMPYWWETWWAYSIWGILVVLLFVGVYTIFDLRRKEQEDAKRIKEIEALKSQLYANITHEFRTPLTLIMGMNEQIVNHEKEKAIIDRNSKKLLHQVNQLLETAKLESGNLKLHLVQRDVVEYLRFLTESFHPLASNKKIKLTFYSEQKEVLMDLDEEKMQDILYNLLSNAIKFTPTEGTIVLHVSKQNVEGTFYIQIKVKDSGIGILPDQTDRIFDRFYQVENLHKTIGAGTGIGLALTRDLIDLMEGTITVSSEPDHGTEFTIMIPVRNQAPISNASVIPPVILMGEDGYEEALTPSMKPDDPTFADQKHLLVIEDNLDIARFLADLLKKEYIVHIAENGAEGIQKAFEIIPDAVISDVNMPLKDGYEVCETLKMDQKTSHIPIILLTANSAQQNKLEGLRYGADAYLTKPFNREELEIRLQKLIELRKKLQEYYSNVEVIMSSSSKRKDGNSVEDKFLSKLHGIIGDHLSDSNFGVPELAEEAGISQMQLYRKLKALTSKTPSQFIRLYRLYQALELLKNSDLNISEIAYDVGFSDPNYFSRTFHSEFGNPPIYYRK